MNLPKVGDKLYMFDDGKINPNRLYEVEITNIIASKNAPQRYHDLLEVESMECNWLYESTTDYFIVANHQHEKEMIFVKEKWGGYFSLGYWAGQLDVDGSWFDKCCEWCGMTEKQMRDNL